MRRACDARSGSVSLDEHVARLAARQHGVFARRQVELLGVTKGMIQHRLTAGRWHRVRREVFRIAGSPRFWRQQLMAACLAWGEGAVVSHRAASALWRLVGFEAGIVELIVPRGRSRTGPELVHRHRLHPTDITVIDGIPVTTPGRTLIDLASVVPPEALEEAIDDAIRRGVMPLSVLRRRVSHSCGMGRAGTAVMRRLLDARDGTTPVPESVFERRLLRVIRRGGLPTPLLQHEVRDGAGLVGVADMAYPDQRLAIEADGFRWHSGRVRWDRDRARRNRLTLLGWRVINVTWTELVNSPNAITEAIRTALTREMP